MKGGRRLTGEEAALWAGLARTVTPLRHRHVPPRSLLAAGPDEAGALSPPPAERRVKGRIPPPALPPSPPPPSPRPLTSGGLDAGWDRRLTKGGVTPDFTLDLHGASLDMAHARLEHGLALALAQGARLVLVIAGRPRPAPDAGDRGSRRGVIRAKLLDWLAHGSHAARIAAVRVAHPRHGGPGAVYVVLRRAR